MYWPIEATLNMQTFKPSLVHMTDNLVMKDDNHYMYLLRIRQLVENSSPLTLCQCPLRFEA